DRPVGKAQLDVRERVVAADPASQRVDLRPVGRLEFEHPFLRARTPGLRRRGCRLIDVDEQDPPRGRHRGARWARLVSTPIVPKAPQVVALRWQPRSVRCTNFHDPLQPPDCKGAGAFHPPQRPAGPTSAPPAARCPTTDPARANPTAYPRTVCRSRSRAPERL